MIVPFVIQSMIKNMPVSSDASALKDPEVAFGVATSVSLPSDMEAFRVEPDLNATALAVQSALLVRILTFLHFIQVLLRLCFWVLPLQTVERIADMGRRHLDAVKQIDRL